MSCPDPDLDSDLAAPPSRQDMTIYILEMLVELIGLAITVGDQELGQELAAVLERRAPQEPVVTDRPDGYSYAVSRA